MMCLARHTSFSHHSAAVLETPRAALLVDAKHRAFCVAYLPLEDAAAIRGWMLAHNQHAVATACVVLSVPATTEMPGYSRSWTQML